ADPPSVHSFPTRRSSDLDRAIHFRSTNLGEGANTALPVFALFMKKVYADSSLGIGKGDFELPPGGLNITLDCDQYYQNNGRATEGEEASPERDIEERLSF